MTSLVSLDNISLLFIREYEEVDVFDHDPRFARAGHGEDCTGNCRKGWKDHIAGTVLWSGPQGIITDPDYIEYLEAKVRRDVWEGPRNALVNLARDMFMNAIIGGASYSDFNNANAAIGVGDSSTAVDPAQTDLQAATNKLRVGMATSYPIRTANAVAFRSTFGLSQGNYAWNERGIFNSTSGSQMLSRKAGIALGTKTSSFSWQITCTDTLTI